MNKLFKTLSIIAVISITLFFLAKNYVFAKHTRTTVFQISSGSRIPHYQRAFFITGNKIPNDETIGKAISDYQLDELWDTNKTDLLKTIKEQANARQVKGTDLIELKTSAKNDEQAQQLAYAIMMTYQDLRINAINQRRNEVIEKYKEKIKFQEDKVKDTRKRLYQISKRLGNRLGRTTLLHHEHSEKPKSLKSRYADKELYIQDLEIFIKSLQDLDDDALIARIITSSRPEAPRVEKEEMKLRKLKDLKQQLLANGLSIDHPKVKSLEPMITKQEKKLSKYGRDIREKLSDDLVSSKKVLAKLKSRIENETDETYDIHDVDHTAFSTVRAEYEREFRILQSLKQAELSEVIIGKLAIEPLKFHKRGWTPETAKMMDARKQ